MGSPTNAPSNTLLTQRKDQENHARFAAQYLTQSIDITLITKQIKYNTCANDATERSVISLAPIPNLTMKNDNQWHHAILVQFKDHSFGIYESLADCERNATKPLPHNPKFQPVKFNYHNGDPIVDLGDFQMRIKLESMHYSTLP